MIKPAPLQTITFSGWVSWTACERRHARGVEKQGSVRSMNQVISKLLVLISSSVMCASCVTVTTLPEGLARIELPQCELESVSEAQCAIRVFDGTNTVDAQRDAVTRAFIDVDRSSVTAPRIVLYSAPHHVPQVRAVRVDTKALTPVRLEKTPDRRGGYLAGVVFRKAEQTVDGSACNIESFLSGRTVIINRVRARKLVTTDNLGSFVVALPAGSYRVSVEDKQLQTVVPPEGTQWVAIGVD